MKNKRTIIPLTERSLNFAFVCVLLASANPTFGGQSTAATITNAASAEIKGAVDIGGRKLEMATYGQGTPAVIVEAGLGEPAVGSGTWKTVVAEIAKTTRICIYDRAGLGQSDAVTNTLRTSQDIVNDLHAMLAKSKLPPPYILVGHSIGGFAVRLYASQYPEEVAGVVLVDSSHPDQWSKWLAALPPEKSGESESIKDARKHLASQLTDPTTNPERLDISASAAQVRAAGNFGDKPLVVLSHSPDWRIAPELPAEVSRKIEQVSQTLQIDICRLSSNSTHRIAAKSGHYIQTDDPQLVIEAILKVRDLIRERRQ